MLREEAAAAITEAVVNQANDWFSDEKTWALQELIRAYCRHGKLDELRQKMGEIVSKMSPQTTLEQAVDRLETWAEDEFHRAAEADPSTSGRLH